MGTGLSRLPVRIERHVERPVRQPNRIVIPKAVWRASGLSGTATIVVAWDGDSVTLKPYEARQEA